MVASSHLSDIISCLTGLWRVFLLCQLQSDRQSTPNFNSPIERVLNWTINGFIAPTQGGFRESSPSGLFQHDGYVATLCSSSWLSWPSVC
ncbi:hypothetical protein CRM22_004632 [Opisthorchis felineus]|uniref:Uncharacterized protein n=1 Tax=Opisthorchis felineus TaxID=147828 RepID=A0A4S2M1I3_OPIFE|nr:hypothetical protein CRM22_004632 [Opisthorchis felineus]